MKDNFKKTYKYGWQTAIGSKDFPKGITIKNIKLLSKIKNEPQWLLDFRIKSYKIWKKMKPPSWQNFKHPKINLKELTIYSEPELKEYESREEVPPELIETFNRLGIPIQEQDRLLGVAVDAVFDSVSIHTTHQEELLKHGVIFCSISEAIEKYPELVRENIGKVVGKSDNYYAALNSAIFTDGSFVYIPKGVTCPLDLSTYFRINNLDSGQFERTLIIAEEDSYVNYLEGCTAPESKKFQLHAAVVEIIAKEEATVNYSTVQNWYSGDKEGRGGIYNFVTKRGLCEGDYSKISWTQIETGSAITWKYPSCILKGDYSEGSFYSVALTHDRMEADTGTKMIHIGKGTKSKIISKGISLDNSNNTYRGLVKILKSAEGARNYSQCDSMLVGSLSKANTFPYIESKNNNAVVEHEASTSRISEDQLFYIQQRGLDMEKTISLIISGFCQDVFKQLPLEFSVEAVKLIELKLENSIG